MLVLETGETLQGKAGTASAITWTLHLDTPLGSADTFKKPQGVLTGSTAVLYTAPGTGPALIKEITFVNTTALNVNGITLYAGGSATGNQILYFSIPANGTATFDGDLRVKDSTGALQTTGSTGPSGTVSIGTVTNVGVAGPPTVTNVGTPSAAVLNFGLQQGATGSTGPAGVVQTVTAGDATLIAGGTAADPTLRKAPLTGDVTTVLNVATIKNDVALAGNPTTTTQAVNTSNTTIATTAYVNAEIANDAPPVTLTAAGAAPNANAASLSGQALTLQPASASFPGNQSAANFRKQRDQYYDAVNDLGIDPTGSVDATTILTNWHTSLPAAGGAVLRIPANTRMRVDGPVTFSKDNIAVEGADRRSSIIGTGSATANQFNVTGDACVFRNLRFEAGTTAQNLALRTAGYCVEFQAASNGSGVQQVDIIGCWSGINLEGCQLPFVDDVSIREYGANATAGTLIRVNTNSAGGDTFINRVITDNGSNIANYAGVRIINTASLVMTNCNIIHATNGIAIEPANAGTVPSLKLSNCFFDNCTNGLRFNPTGTGVWFRSEFINCWFGSNSAAGIKFESPQFSDIVFTNCDILGNPVGIDANAGGGYWTLNGGCQIAGSSTAGIRLAASANHFPVIQGNRIRPQLVGGAFGANAVGIIVGAGAYLGLVIQGNDVSQNTSALTLGAVTIAGGTALDYTRFRITDNTAINPRGTNLAPAVPAAGTSATNTTGFRVSVHAKNGATAPASLIVNGVAAVPANSVATTGANILTLEPGGTIGFTTTTAASWQWIGQ